MSTVELKTDLHRFIDSINDSKILKVIHTILKNSLQSGVIGYSGSKPLTKKAFIKRIEKAEAEIKRGEFVTIEQLEKESESW